MPSYLIETYLARGTAADLEQAAAGVRQAAEALSREGRSVRYLRTTFLAEDELCFHVLEAESIDPVAEAVHRAGLRFARITLAVEAASGSAQGLQPT